MSTQKRQRMVLILFTAATFLFFLVFFTRIHPIVVFDTDGWRYSCLHRSALPLWKAWNPSRVLPEVLMPLASQLGAQIFYPIVGDIFFSLTLTHAIVVSTGIALLTWMLMRHFQREGSGVYACIAIGLLFLICHFLILRSAPSENSYMLLSVNGCCYYFYVLPNLLNCALALWLMDDPDLLHFFSGELNLKKSAFVLFAYLCIFSNIWACITTAVYSGVTLLFRCVDAARKRGRWFADYMKENAILFVVLALWLAAQFFEYNGGRSVSVRNDHFFAQISQVFSYVRSTLRQVSRPYLCVAALLLAGGAIVALRMKNRDQIRAGLSALICEALIGLYLIVTCAMAGPAYIARPDVFYGVFFMGMLVLLIAFSQIIRHVRWVRLVVPVCLLVLAVGCNTTEVTYLESTMLQTPPDVCNRINRDILKQLQAAEDAGLTEVELYVPLYSGDNWPIAVYAGDDFAIAFQKLGVLKTRLHVTQMIPSEEKNAQLHVPPQR